MTEKQFPGAIRRQLNEVARGLIHDIVATESGWRVEIKDPLRPELDVAWSSVTISDEELKDYSARADLVSDVLAEIKRGQHPDA